MIETDVRIRDIRSEIARLSIMTLPSLEYDYSECRWKKADTSSRDLVGEAIAELYLMIDEINENICD